GYRQGRNGPKEPVRGGYGLRAAARGVNSSSHPGRRGPGSFIACTNRSFCCLPERIDEPCAAKHSAQTLRQRGGNVILLVGDQVCDAAGVESTLLLGNRAHDNRSQRAKQRAACGRSQPGILANCISERVLIAATKQRSDHL